MGSLFVRRFLAGFIMVAMLFTLSSCGEPEYLSVRVDVDGYADNLDPQFSVDETGLLVIKNTFRGLFSIDENGEIQPEIAESYKVSSDGKTYTFSLRDDAYWSNGEPVTADDFVFAFERMFDSKSPSPYAQQYISIENASEILAGEIDISQLGVKSTGEYTLSISIVEENGSFLESLAQTPTMPCNEQFFDETRARYGMSKAHIMGNGPFFVSYWDATSYVLLQKNDDYYDNGEVLSPYVYIYMDRAEEDGETLLDIFIDDKSDFYYAVEEDIPQLQSADAVIKTLDDRAWSLMFNSEDTALSNQNIRVAMQMVLNRVDIANRITDEYSLSDSVIPPEVTDISDDFVAPISYDVELAKELYSRGLQETTIGEIDGIYILIPEDMGMETLASYMIKQWKDHHNLYVNIDAVPYDEYINRLATGDYDMAFIELRSSANTPFDVLESFYTHSEKNIYAYSNSEYDALIESAERTSDKNELADISIEAEKVLVHTGVLYPLFTAQSYYAFSSGSGGIDINNGYLDLEHAYRE